MSPRVLTPSAGTAVPPAQDAGPRDAAGAVRKPSLLGPHRDLAAPACTHWRPGMTRHAHETRDERLACDAEHDRIRARWDAIDSEEAR